VLHQRPNISHVFEWPRSRPEHAQCLDGYVHRADRGEHACHGAVSAREQQRAHEPDLDRCQALSHQPCCPIELFAPARHVVRAARQRTVELAQSLDQTWTHAQEDKLAHPAFMPAHPDLTPGEVLRHFTVAVFVVHANHVLLHYHRKLGKWLPPGGHIEDNELPDMAAVREVLEETGVHARLVGKRGLPVDTPLQLVVPSGIQVENIYPGHQHIDLVYFAVPVDDAVLEIDASLAALDRVGWYALDELVSLGVDDEIQAWSQRALDAIVGAC
jgi:8-oxo-dGTP pyrophosphatase MutT (NUDIX family)